MGMRAASRVYPAPPVAGVRYFQAAAPLDRRLSAVGEEIMSFPAPK
jgi:hypothetical protein